MGLKKENVEELKQKSVEEPKYERLEVKVVKDIKPNPLLGNRDMVMIMCFICSILLTYIFFDKGIIIMASNDGVIEYMVIIIGIVSYVTGILFWITQKIVKYCYFSAKRKADTKVD